MSKRIKEEKLNIKKKDTGKIKNLTNFLSSDNFDFVQYKMSLKYSEIKLNKKEFHKSKQPIYLNQV